MQFSCYLPKIEFGFGKLKMIGQYSKKLGFKRVMLVIDPFLDSICLSDKIQKYLDEYSIGCIKVTKIKPNPDCYDVDEAAVLARSEECDSIVAVGGGSALDFGKGVAVIARNKGKCWEFTERSDHEVRRPGKTTLPVIAIPTTSGTGSEVTPFAVFNNPSLKEKSTIVTDRIYPVLALIDPELTLSMSSRLTSSTGFDAFTHAYESYMSLKATPYTKLLAREAMQIIIENLPKAVSNGSNKEARKRMSWASTIAGSAIATIGVTLGHALGQPVSGISGAPHGESVAACTVKITEISYMSNIEVFADVARMLDPSIVQLSVKHQAKKCSELIKEFLNDIKLTVRFSDFGMTEKDIKEATRIAMTGYYFDIQCHPLAVTSEDIISIYKACL